MHHATLVATDRSNVSVTAMSRTLANLDPQKADPLGSDSEVNGSTQTVVDEADSEEGGRKGTGSEGDSEGVDAEDASPEGVSPEDVSPEDVSSEGARSEEADAQESDSMVSRAVEKLTDPTV